MAYSINQTKEDTLYFTNYELIVPYVLPYFLYVAIAGIFGFTDVWANYALRVLVVSFFIYRYWEFYVPLTGPKSRRGSVFIGLLFGLFGTFIWICFLSIFVEPGGEALDTFSFYMKMISITTVVPIFEELLMRVYVFRLAHQWYLYRKEHKDTVHHVLHERSLNDVKPGEWSVFAIVFSTLVFTLGHGYSAWVSCLLYGPLMVSLWIIRKDIISCIVAHGCTNFALAIYVYTTGNWNYW